MGLAESPPSPSYVLVREFKGMLPLYHMDLYRLEFEEIGELGLEDYLFGKGVCVIEWAEKAASLMPKENLHINLSYAGDRGREIEITPHGKHYQIMSGRIAAHLEALLKGDT
jgi:tRNA threonylcarbamoyladenosine biosynthesis protein TsaE